MALEDILTAEEMAVVHQIGDEKDLSDAAVIRQALRLYQQHDARLKAGETVTWSGDAQRARDFAGPLYRESKTLDDVWIQAATNHDTYSATGSDDEDLKFFAVGIAGEAGEMLEVLMPFIMAAVAAGRLNNLIKKKWRDGPNDDRDHEIRLELADIAAYTFMACRSMGMGPQDLIDLVAYKQQKFLAKMDAQGNEQRDLQPVATAFDFAELLRSAFRDIGDGPFVVERKNEFLGPGLGTSTGAVTDLGAWLMTHREHPAVQAFVLREMQRLNTGA